MTNNQILALHKALEKKIKKENIGWEPGTYEFDDYLLLRLIGDVKKGERVEYTPTVSIPLVATLAIVFQKAGFQRENAKALIIEAMTEAIDAMENGAPHIQERMADIKECEKHVQDIVGALPKKTREGATTANLNIVELDYKDVKRMKKKL